KPVNSETAMWHDFVIQQRQDRSALKSQMRFCLRSYSSRFWILLCIQRSTTTKAGLRARSPYVLEHHFIAGQWLACPVSTDQAEHPVVNRVPFACSRWKMRDGNLQTELIGEALQGHFPFPLAVVIGTTTICFDQQMPRRGVLVTSDIEPPFSDAIDRK